MVARFHSTRDILTYIRNVISFAAFFEAVSHYSLCTTRVNEDTTHAD
jgi:hypothetical protein